MRDARGEEERGERFLRPERPEIQRKSRAPRGRRLLGSARPWLQLLAVVGLTVAAALALTRSSRLQVRRVEFDGLQRSSPAAAEQVRRSLLGRNVLSIDLDAARRRLLAADPWVADVTVRRVPLDRIVLMVTERVAVARLADGSLLAADGKALAPGTPSGDDAALPALTVAAAGPERELGLGRAAELLVVLGGGDDSPRVRSETLDATDPEDLVLTLGGQPYALHLGGGDFATRLNRFRNVEPVLRARYDSLETVDLRFRDRVVVAPVPNPSRMTPASGG